MHRFAMIALAATLAALGACGSTAKVSKTFQAPLSKPVAVDIQNVNGSVIVRADGSSNEIVVTAERWISENVIKGQDPQLHYNDLWNPEDMHIELVEQEGGAVLVVRSGELNTDRGVRIDLHIQMPSLNGVEIRNSGGLVELVNISGAVRVHNQMGPIDVRTSYPLADEITLTTTRGNIYLQCPPGSSASVDMLTLDGVVSFRDKVDESSGTHASDTGNLTAFMGAGGNEVLCRTDEGNIYVWMMDNPLAYSRSIRPIIKNPIDSLFLRGSRRFTRELSEDHPEITNYRAPEDRDAY